MSREINYVLGNAETSNNEGGSGGRQCTSRSAWRTSQFSADRGIAVSRDIIVNTLA
jgi:hypothetical protein